MKRCIFIFAAIVATSLLVFAGCQTLAAVVKDPVVSIHSVDIAKVGFTGVNLLCKVNVENPNSFDISFPELEWELFLNSNPFVKGTIKNDNTLRAGQTTVVDVPVRMNYLDIFNAFRSIAGTAQANYKLELGIVFNLPVLGRRVLRLDNEGILPLR